MNLDAGRLQVGDAAVLAKRICSIAVTIGQQNNDLIGGFSRELLASHFKAFIHARSAIGIAELMRNTVLNCFQAPTIQFNQRLFNFSSSYETLSK